MKSLLLMLLIVQGYQCLKNVRLRAPQAVRTGESLSLTCDFTLEQEHLYSVKFYWEDMELYRYIPQESPPTRVFPMPGFNIDISRSNSSSLTLSEIHRGMTGYYKCEVSADAPLFHTDIQSTFITVVEEPWGLPSIRSEKPKYSLKEKVRANCSSFGGSPPANLTWFINGQAVRQSYKTKVLYQILWGQGPDMADSAVLRLETEASPQLFQDGRLRLRCEAAQFSLYRRSAELELLEDTPQLAPVLGPTSSHESSSGAKPCLRDRVPSLLIVLLMMLVII